ncbi:APC family permease [Vulcanisaeta thermophila]|uniref:APC family permease n=1 Tax=Vulcanisaeta thermophila TaxID=867917 RepID=UPI000ABCA87F|nr:APC family permease [Vulcanisaeta thermophila]
MAWIPGEERASKYDAQLRRALSFWDIAYLEIGSMIGSGWMFAPLFAAAVAGPASILSWLIAGILVYFIAEAYTEVASAFPRSGGLVRFPQYTHGLFAAFWIGWVTLLYVIAVAPAEALASTTYLSAIFPQLLIPGTSILSPLGYLVAAVLLIFYFFLNWFGVHVMGKVNTAVGWYKLLIPTFTVILLLAFLLHPINYSGLPGGFMPYGLASVFVAIPTTGIAFAYLGFRQSVEFSGEVRRPREIAIGAVLGFTLVVIIYVLLETAFVGAIEWSKVGVTPGDWKALTSSVLVHGPIYQVLTLSGISVLLAFAVFMIIDSILSPSGTGWIYIGGTARSLYGMAANGQLPEFFLHLNKYRVPKWGTIAALILGFLFIYKFPAWSLIVGFITSAGYFTFIISGPLPLALRKMAPNIPRYYRIPAISIFSALATISVYLILYWSTFDVLWGVVVFMLAGLPLFFIYVLPKLGASRSEGIIAGIIYWLALVLSTVFLLYYPVVVPYQKLHGLPLNTYYVGSFLSFYLIMLALTVGLTLFLSRKIPREARQHINAGWWVVAVIFTVLPLSFFGQFGYLAKPLIPFPYDTLIAIIMGVAIHLYAVRSAFMTEDLKAAIQRAGSP